jgi:hypothetical protein
MLTGYRVSEFSGETGIPKNVVLGLIRAGKIKADKTGKRWWLIPYTERARIARIERGENAA